jgi:integrase
MPRKIRSATLETRTARLKLPVAKKPVFVRIGPGVALGYRRNQSAGTWVVRCADGRGSNWTKAIGVADDLDDGASTLTFWQAQDRARKLAHKDGGGDKLQTVAEAIAAYEADLKARGADAQNVARVLFHLPSALAANTVPLLTAKELRRWRDDLLKEGLAPPSVKRTCTILKAALNLAAAHDPRITNSAAWKVGLKSLPDAESSRNVIVSEPDLRAIVGTAYSVDHEFGLLIECAAVTGARYSQLARLQVGDLQGSKGAPRLQMPTSKKGRGTKRIGRYPVPIGASLAAKLRSNRPADEPLLLHRGIAWRPSEHRHPFLRAVGLAKIKQPGVTIYALRHSSIVRQLLAAIPIRVVAVNHDTSVAMIERTYSKHIGGHTDAMTRSALIDIE